MMKVMRGEGDLGEGEGEEGEVAVEGLEEEMVSP